MLRNTVSRRTALTVSQTESTGTIPNLQAEGNLLLLSSVMPTKTNTLKIDINSIHFQFLLIQNLEVLDEEMLRIFFWATIQASWGHFIGGFFIYSRDWETPYKTESLTIPDWEHNPRPTLESVLIIFDHNHFRSFVVLSVKACICDNALESGPLCRLKQ